MKPTTARKTMFRIGILTEPISKAGMTGTSNLIEIVTHFSHDIYLITGSDVYRNFKRHNVRAYGVSHQSAKNVVARILGHIFLQLKISYVLSKIVAETDLWLFYIGGDLLVLPMIVVKLFRKRVLLVRAGSTPQTFLALGEKLSAEARLLSRMSSRIADNIILYSPILVEKWNLGRYRKKIIIARHHFLNFNEFDFKDNLEQRNNVVGFVGRLSVEKGILNLVEAIPKTLTKLPDVKFLIIGTGRLEDDIRISLEKYVLDGTVELTGWIPRSELPDWFNKLRLLVLPSSPSEGLPNVIVEAMACGTPVLATPVSATPDVIKDKETGFFLRDNSPKCIADGIVETLGYPNLKQIVINARKLVESEFRYEDAVEKWKNIICGTKVE
jgi:glycosyltransferase involved in cell wall biosynthesis